MDKICLFGKGFVGSEFVKQFPDTIVQDRNDFVPATRNILYGISTTHNYHVKDGEPYLDIDTNQKLLVTTLENARLKYGNEFTVTFLSSWFVYGKTECPAREDSYCNPAGFYSITKRAAEQLLISYCEIFGMTYKILRLANVIGIGDKKISRKKNALQYMIQQVAYDNDIDYLYNTRAIRDFIDVRDVVKAIKLVMDGGNPNEIYNVGNGIKLVINDLVHFANEYAGRAAQITEMDAPEFHKVVQVKDMWLDITKLRLLGYSPEYNIYETVKELVDYYKVEKNG